MILEFYRFLESAESRGLQIYMTLLNQQKTIASDTSSDAESRASVHYPLVTWDAEQMALKSLETTRISADTVFHGSIQSSANLDIYGYVFGNVSCNGSIRLTGLIKGNVTAEQIKIEGGRIQGSITSKRHVGLDRCSLVNGEISAETILIEGKVKGNIYAGESVKITESAQIQGDVIAQQLRIQKGAILSGFLTILNPSVRADPFDDG